MPARFVGRPMEWSTRSMSKDGVSAQPAQKSPVQKHKGEDQHSGKGALQQAKMLCLCALVSDQECLV